jgi:amino acid transporter
VDGIFRFQRHHVFFFFFFFPHIFPLREGEHSTQRPLTLTLTLILIIIVVVVVVVVAFSSDARTFRRTRILQSKREERERVNVWKEETECV